MIQGARIIDLNEVLMAINGNVRGRVLLSHFDYIEKREGKEGVKRIEEELKFLKHSVCRDNIKKGRWYREGLGVLIIAIARDFFFWRGDDIFEMGSLALEFSLLQKITNIKKCSPSSFADVIKGYWRKNYDFGSVDVVDIKEKDKRFKIVIHGYYFHSLIIQEYIRGYFFTLTRKYLRSTDVSIEVRKSVFQGDDFNEYEVSY